MRCEFIMHIYIDTYSISRVTKRMQKLSDSVGLELGAPPHVQIR